jgi:hypothetical protein
MAYPEAGILVYLRYEPDLKIDPYQRNPEAGILVYVRYEPVLKIDPYLSRSEKSMEFCQGT